MTRSNRIYGVIHPDQAKTKKAIPVPLNTTAMNVIRQQIGKHPLDLTIAPGEIISATRIQNR